MKIVRVVVFNFLSKLSDDRGEDMLLRLPLDLHCEWPGLVSPSDS